MKAVDWQAYLDGSLSAEERQRAEALLREDPSAQRELEGLKSFRAAVREAALAEEAPIARLEALLKESAPKKGKPVLRYGLSAASLAVAAVLFWIFFVMDPDRLNRTPTRETLATTSPSIAARWAREKTKIPAPVISLDNARMFMARYGDGWACYDYVVDGQIFYLYVAKDATPFLDASTLVERNGVTYYHARGVGWQQEGLAFYLRGGTAKDRQRLAEHVSDQIQKGNS